MSLRLLGMVPGLLLALAGNATAGAQCPLDWTGGFSARGLTGDVHTMAVFDDGSGSSLYVGGRLFVAGSVQYEAILNWDGLVWSALGSRLTGPVYALGAYDLGAGCVFYAAGSFASAGGQLV